MKATGIVVEYNPFHNGHKYHINEALKQTKPEVLIAVMSPNFVQRGEPAIMPKDVRIKAALENGINIVVELPFIYAVESADIFAQYSVEILERLFCTYIVFGSETGDTKEFMKKYNNNELITSPRLDEEIQKLMDKGYGYPKAYSEATKKIKDFYLETPNDILANSYLSTINNQEYTILPVSIKRNDVFKNAREIRGFINKNEKISSFTAIKYDKKDIHLYDSYFNLLKYKLLSTPIEQLSSIHLVTEGIENLLLKNIKQANNMEEFISMCISKRYSGARIRRIIAHILCGTDAKLARSILSKPIPYIRIVGIDGKGKEYLKSIRKRLEVPVYAKFVGREDSIAQIEKRASDVYYMVDAEPERTKLQEKEIFMFPIIK